jgi:hypothetical protein
MRQIPFFYCFLRCLIEVVVLARSQYLDVECLTVGVNVKNDFHSALPPLFLAALGYSGSPQLMQVPGRGPEGRD